MTRRCGHLFARAWSVERYFVDPLRSRLLIVAIIFLQEFVSFLLCGPCWEFEMKVRMMAPREISTRLIESVSQGAGHSGITCPQRW